MPKINCQWTTCKYNNSKHCNDETGECTKDEIVLNHKTVDDFEEIMDSLLDCISYKWDKEKDFK